MPQYKASSNPLVLIADSNLIVRPIFKLAPVPTPTPKSSTPVTPTPYTITLISSNAGWGSVGFRAPQVAVGSNVFVGTEPTRVEFTAEENTGYEFVGWYLDGVLWSTNRSPAILYDKDATFEARFKELPPEKRCVCYYIAPLDSNTSYEVRYRRCDTNELVTETFTTFRNICSANIPQAGRNAQVPQLLGTDCTNNYAICGTPPQPSPTPTSTPAPSRTPAPSVTPSAEVVPSPTPSRTPGPSVSATPQPTPTPSPAVWKSCIDGSTIVGFPPAGYRQGIYQGNDLGMICYEPLSNLGFIPPLNTMTFDWQRGSAKLPDKKEVIIENPSYSASYNIKLTIDETLFTVEPSVNFVILPRDKKTLRIGVNPNHIAEFGDGQTTFGMKVETVEIIK